ncbi:hypothetical protein K450DRAFT_280490 [Umbelopsis ramanniana AG]|uniref:Uncharacterized protein n=1 Tax=Umbelopsis ramanniana AG TaxID=1314678 RepID=A0AAD5E9A3_UMBRA|nr:uncharacterized protein K450DRAFT_280490 [Umbelopsis ramanniana AG]KAI8579778.1 hypothetical protein K450DRAFT_280490 [Umbelopsis ramanniana AG]
MDNGIYKASKYAFLQVNFPAMSALNIQNYLQAYATWFAMNPIFINHGFQLLRRHLNLDTSNNVHLHFLSDASHQIDMRNCVDLVYIKIWCNDLVPTANPLTMDLPEGARVYIGQTANPRAREHALQPYISAFGVPTLHLCVAHNLSQYHRDALECAIIAWFTLFLGLAVLNKSPYGNYIYREVNPNATVDEILPSDYRAVHSFSNWRLTIVVGTAPPAGVALAAAYRDRMERHPLMNWDAFPNTGLGMLRFNLVQYALPPFINHYPDDVSRGIDDWYPHFDQEKVNNADRNLKQSMREHSRPIALMLGARPTRLVDGSLRNNFMSDRCGRLNFSRLNSGRFIAMLWMPDPSHYRHFRLQDKMFGVELYTLASKAIYTLEEKFLSGRDGRADEQDDFGFTSLEVEMLQFWWDSHPLCAKIRQLCLKVALIPTSYKTAWTGTLPVVNTGLFDSVPTNLWSTLPTTYVDIDMLTIPGDTSLYVDKTEEGLTLPTDTLVLSGRQDQSDEPATVSIEGTIRHDTRIIRMATRDNPNFSVLSTAEQVQVVRRAIGQYARILNVGFKDKRIAEGHFHPLPDEPEDVQVARSRREYYDQQSHTIRGNQFLSTCSLCNFHLPARTYTRNRSILFSSGCLCGRTRFIEGCHFVQGQIPLKTFPDNNVFIHHIMHLPVPLVINHKQLVVSVIDFLETEGTTYFQSQAQPIIEIYGAVFANYKAYRNQEKEHKTLSTAFSRMVNQLYRDLRTITGFETIGPRSTSRAPKPIERAAYGTGTPNKFTLYSFGALTEGSLEEVATTEMETLEDMDFCQYGSRLTELAQQKRAERDAAAGGSGQAEGSGRAGPSGS